MLGLRRYSQQLLEDRGHVRPWAALFGRAVFGRAVFG